MIHYHGTPAGGKRIDAFEFLKGRHALVPWLRQDDLPVVAEFCQSFVFDNSAFSAWNSGKTVNWDEYFKWCDEWHRHPGFDWALIPDVIDGGETDNDALIAAWPKHIRGVPVWHMHESFERLDRLCREWPTVALGSSGEWSQPNSKAWWIRMNQAMLAICDRQGRPPARLHGLRMLNTRVFSRLPLSSADSTNASVNSGALDRFGMYPASTRGERAANIAGRIEAVNSAPTFVWGDRTQTN